MNATCLNVGPLALTDLSGETSARGDFEFQHSLESSVPLGDDCFVVELRNRGGAFLMKQKDVNPGEPGSHITKREFYPIHPTKQ